MECRISEGQGEFSVLLPSRQSNQCSYIVFCTGEGKKSTRSRIIAVGTILDSHLAKELSTREDTLPTHR